jgi:hypothetical protein
MINNTDHDLMQQISEISDSVWRIHNEYIKNAAGDEKVVALWNGLCADYERHLGELAALLKERGNEGKW